MAKFRLQRVLDLRQRREDEMRQRLGAATRARVQAEERLRAMLADEDRQRDALATLLGVGRMDAGRVMDGARMLDASASAITAQREEIARRLAFEDEEREKLTRAMSERKALDRLREHHEERERKELNHREATILGEIANAGAARALIQAARER
jgi:flagellar export protein FliJ